MDEQELHLLINNKRDWRQVDVCEAATSLIYIASSKATQQDVVKVKTTTKLLVATELERWRKEEYKLRPSLGYITRTCFKQ